MVDYRYHPRRFQEQPAINIHGYDLLPQAIWVNTWYPGTHSWIVLWSKHPLREPSLTHQRTSLCWLVRTRVTFFHVRVQCLRAFRNESGTWGDDRRFWRASPFKGTMKIQLKMHSSSIPELVMERNSGTNRSTCLRNLYIIGPQCLSFIYIIVFCAFFHEMLFFSTFWFGTIVMWIGFRTQGLVNFVIQFCQFRSSIKYSHTRMFICIEQKAFWCLLYLFCETFDLYNFQRNVFWPCLPLFQLGTSAPLRLGQRPSPFLPPPWT